MPAHSKRLPIPDFDELPFDFESELNAIGAVMIAPSDHARKFVKSVSAGVFQCPQHRWLWKRLQEALIRDGIDFDHEVGYWLIRHRIVAQYRQSFHQPLIPLIASCLRDAFWWHGWWYLDRVVETAQVRQRIIKAATEYEAAVAPGKAIR